MGNLEWRVVMNREIDMGNIPKIVHYCWFGGKEKPELVKRCIDTWRGKLPDYKIIEWNEKNFDINSSDFSRQAYKNKKWAFVADYCRLNVLYNNGGIYLDTDMEVIKSLDIFLNNVAFARIEFANGNIPEINAAIWGCKKGDKFIEKLISYYDSLDFNEYAEDLFKLAIPKVITTLAKEDGYIGSKFPEKLSNGTVIYSKEYFYPKNKSWEIPTVTENTYTIHHYEGSWKSPILIYRTKLKHILINIFGYERVNSLVRKFKKK